MDQNSIVRTSNVANDLSSMDESDSSFIDSVSNENEAVEFQPPCQQSNIGHIRIKKSNEIIVGNRIIYTVNIRQRIHRSDFKRDPNRIKPTDSESTENIADQSAESVHRSADNLSQNCDQSSIQASFFEQSRKLIGDIISIFKYYFLVLLMFFVIYSLIKPGNNIDCFEDSFSNEIRDYIIIVFKAYFLVVLVFA